jgi:2-(1,2-epoxy-1,2-dihydrophenyl)acetyl-CoA isomerase
MLCDTIVAGRSARFGFPFTKIGLVPDYGLAETLAWRIGPSRARQVLLRAQWVDAPEALACGLADEVVDDDDVQARALEVAAELAGVSPFGLRATKHLLSPSLDELLAREAALQALCLTTDESARARASLRERATPASAPQR